MRMKLSAIKLGFEVVVIVVLLVFLIVGLSLPCFLEVTVLSKSVYEGQSVGQDDIRLVSKSLFGVKHELKDYKLENDEDDKTVRVTAGGLSQEVVFNKIPISYLQAEYLGRFYQNDTAIVTADDFYVRVVYGNNVVEELSFEDYTIEGLPDVFTEDVTVKIRAGDHSTNVTVRPIRVMSLDVVYTDGLHIGDTFDVTKAALRVKFEDGETMYDKELSSEFSGVVAVDSEIKVVSAKYGEAVVPIDKSNVAGYDIDTVDKIYAGDTLSTDSFHLSAKLSDGSLVPITDFEFGESRVFEESKVDIITQGYGTLKCTIKPVLIKEFLAEGSVSNSNVLKITSITAVYEDDKKKKLNLDDVKFITDLSKPISVGENHIQFQWFGHDCSVVVKYVE